MLIFTSQWALCSQASLRGLQSLSQTLSSAIILSGNRGIPWRLQHEEDCLVLAPNYHKYILLTHSRIYHRISVINVRINRKYLWKWFPHSNEIIVNLKLDANLELIAEAHLPESVSRKPQLSPLEFLLLARQLHLRVIKWQLTRVYIASVQLYING